MAFVIKLASKKMILGSWGVCRARQNKQNKNFLKLSGQRFKRELRDHLYVAQVVPQSEFSIGNLLLYRKGNAGDVEVSVVLRQLAEGITLSLGGRGLVLAIALNPHLPGNFSEGGLSELNLLVRIIIPTFHISKVVEKFKGEQK